MSKNKLTIEYLKDVMKSIANRDKIHPQSVTLAQLIEEDSNITEWAIRKFGGLSGIKKYFPLTNKDLLEIKKQKDLTKYVNKLEKDLSNKMSFEKEVLSSINLLGKNLPKLKTTIKKAKKSKKKKNMTVELMLSDIHYGKKTDTFNLEVCRSRMRELSYVFLSEIKQKQSTFNVESIILAMLGDMIESASFHGMESMAGSEFGNSQQVQEAIESLFYDLLLPVAELGIPIKIPCVPGNHDRSELKKTMNNPGINNLSWIIYKMLEALTKAHKLKNVEFIITKGSYLLLEVYNSNILYEHGDEVKNTAKNTILNHIEKRGRQLKKQVHMIRLGHYHEFICYNRGHIIINESVCGQDSYADIKGFDSTPGQTINYYVETTNRPTCFYYSFPVFLG